MRVAQQLAGEANETIKLQKLGVSSNGDLEFSCCLQSSGHELTDIGNHLLECSQKKNKKNKT